MTWVVTLSMYLLRILFAVLLFLLLLLALPFRYGGTATWSDGSGALEWRLTWGWLVPLDKMIKKRMLQNKEEQNERKKAEGKDASVQRSPTKRVKAKRGSLADAIKASQTGGVSQEPDTEPVATEEAPISGNATAVDEAPAESEVRRGIDTHATEKPTSSPNAETKDASEAHSDRSEAGNEFVSMQDLLQELWGQRNWLLSWLGRIWRLFHLSPLTIDGRLGLGDPYQTNEVFSRLFSLRPFLHRSIDLRLQPTYVDAVVELDIALSGWLSPLQVLWLALRLYFDRIARKLYFKYKSVA